MPRTIAYLTLAGELDAACRDELAAALGPLADADVAIIDFADVSYCDSTAIGCLVGLHRRMQQTGRGGAIRIVRPSRPVSRILELCGLDDLFAVHDTLHGAGLNGEDGSSSVSYVGNYDAGSLIGEAPKAV